MLPSPFSISPSVSVISITAMSSHHPRHLFPSSRPPKQRRIINSFSSKPALATLPLEVLLHILSFLPRTQHLNFASVCNSLRTSVLQQPNSILLSLDLIPSATLLDCPPYAPSCLPMIVNRTIRLAASDLRVLRLHHDIPRSAHQNALSLVIRYCPRLEHFAFVDDGAISPQIADLIPSLSRLQRLEISRAQVPLVSILPSLPHCCTDVSLVMMKFHHLDALENAFRRFSQRAEANRIRLHFHLMPEGHNRYKITIYKPSQLPLLVALRDSNADCKLFSNLSCLTLSGFEVCNREDFKNRIAQEQLNGGWTFPEHFRLRIELNWGRSFLLTNVRMPLSRILSEEVTIGHVIQICNNSENSSEIIRNARLLDISWSNDLITLRDLTDSNRESVFQFMRENLRTVTVLRIGHFQTYTKEHLDLFENLFENVQSISRVEIDDRFMHDSFVHQFLQILPAFKSIQELLISEMMDYDLYHSNFDTVHRTDLAFKILRNLPKILKSVDGNCPSLNCLYMVRKGSLRSVKRHEFQSIEESILTAEETVEHLEMTKPKLDLSTIRMFLYKLREQIMKISEV